MKTDLGCWLVTIQIFRTLIKYKCFYANKGAKQERYRNKFDKKLLYYNICCASGIAHHSNEISSTVLSSQLLFPILLHDDGTQAAAEHYKSTVRLITLPEREKERERMRSFIIEDLWNAEEAYLSQPEGQKRKRNRQVY